MDNLDEDNTSGKHVAQAVAHLYCYFAFSTDVSPSVAYVNANSLVQLDIFRGDYIICKGKNRKNTVLILALNDELKMAESR